WVPNHKNIVVYTAGWAGKFIPILGEMLLSMLEVDLETFQFGPYAIDRSHFNIQWQKIRGETSPYFKRGLQDGMELDVAIVGAGASGLYSGYRLKTGIDKNGRTPDLNVQVFEMSERIGGRLESVQLPGMDVVGEIGGMRYMTSQRIVTALIEDVFATQYGLEAVDFPMGSPYHHLFYLRGQRFFASAFQQTEVTGEKFRTRYFVDEEYQGKSADAIFNEIVSNVLEADGYSLEKIQDSQDPRREWNQVKKKLRYRFEGPYQDKYVYEIGFWNLIKDQTSQECYEFLAQAGGYYSNTINWNAAEAFPYMVGDFADSTTKYKTIQDGYDQILVCLANSFIQAGGDIWVCNRLITFDKNPD
ncbi:MAG: NAD(P)-binding protein, partial [Phycisphaerae bacterium]|nr:NAD(P)-binding protein [Phycisphaerae bacterium]